MADSESGIVGAQLSEGAIIAGRYEIVKPLGAGGMGSVYLARDIVLEGEEIAIKVLHPEFARDEKHTQRFLREVQLMRRVNHKNVVRTYDLGSDGPLVYFTMEYVQGFSLSDIIRAKAFPQNQLAPMIIQICEGLDAIHAAGIVHRDLKPGNIILLRDGTIKIADFGVARPEKSELTAHNEIIGSASYMAPEIWLGKKITYSVDLYSLGIVLYVLTTGRLPFDAEGAAALMRMHTDRAPLPPKELNRSIEPWLNKLILKLLAKSPAERPQSGRAIIDYIKEHLEPRKSDELKTSSDSYSISKPFISMLEERSQRAVAQSPHALPTPKLRAFNMLAWATSGSFRALLFHRMFDRYRYSARYTALKNQLASSAAAVSVTAALFSLFYIAAAAVLNTVLHPLSDDGGANIDSLRFIAVNGTPRALLFLILLSFPCAMLCAVGGSVRSAFAGAAAALIFLAVGASSTLAWLLTPALKHGEVAAPALRAAAAAVRDEVTAAALFSPMTPHFKFSTAEQGLVLASSSIDAWHAHMLTALLTVAYLLVVSWMAAGSAGLKETRRVLFTAVGTCGCLTLMYVSSYRIDPSQLKIVPLLGVALPKGALYVSACIASAMGIITFALAARR